MSIASPIGARTKMAWLPWRWRWWQRAWIWCKQFWNCLVKRETVLVSPLVNPPDLIDTDKVSEFGKRDALAGRPREGEAIAPAGIQFVEKILRDYYHDRVGRCQDVLNYAEDRCNRLAVEIEQVNLTSKAEKIIANMLSRLDHANSKASIHFYKKEFSSKREDLQKFKLEHNLNYDPSRGTDKSRLPFGVSPSVLVVTVLYVVESFLNGFMFIPRGGLLAGLTISLFASLVNVILGFIVGRYVTSAVTHHPIKSMRFLNGILFFLFLLAIGYLNFMLAAIRSDLPASLIIWPFANLLQFKFEGALLVGVGIVFALSALMDGRFSDDPFPGYGHRYRSCIKQRDLVEEHLQAYKILFDAEIANARTEMDALFATAHDDINRWGRHTNFIQRIFVDYDVLLVAPLRDQHLAAWEGYTVAHRNHWSKDHTWPETLKTPPEFFVQGDNLNPAHVFSDVAASHMNDKEREAKEVEFKRNVSSCHEEFQARLVKSIEGLQTELGHLEKESECHI